MTTEPNPRGGDFIRDIINRDLASGKHDRVVTRFPPEPNGYPHIGHAKAVCLNFGIARDYDGVCHLRMDDTDPTKEDVEYVEAIKRDIRWLGFDWGDKLFYASDYYERLYEYAVELIKRGKAYVCSLSEEEVRAYRGTVTEPGRNSPYRDRSVKENLDLFARMRAGEFDDGAHILRAKIDMASPNMKMRDPPIYRIRKVSHYRTGDAWCIYPLYDFAHCLSDAIEGITHSLCTLEFENNRELYDWILDTLETENRPHQYESARLNLNYTVMSKRRLLQLVQEKHVDGWDDPRMPTLAGLRRRGYTPESIRNFCDRVGVAKANSTVDVGQLEFSIRDDLNHKAPRVMAVLEPLKVIIDNFPEGEVHWLDASYWPHDVPKTGSRKVPFTRELFIERTDFEKVPPKGFRRLSPQGQVRLRYGYVITCTEVLENDQGEVVALRCTFDPDTKSGQGQSKVKGTIHWVSASHAVDAEVRLYDRLFRVENPMAEPNFLDAINPDSLRVVRAKLEPSLGEAKAAEHFQFERHGYFFVDPSMSTQGAPVFNRVVPLKDSWSKIVRAEAAESEQRPTPEAKSPKPPKDTSKGPAPKREIDLDGVAGARALHEGHGISPEDAVSIADEASLHALFTQAVALHDNPVALANWVVNDVRRVLKERGETRVQGAQLASLVRLVDAGTISSKIAKDVFAILVDEGGDPEVIVTDRGWTQTNDRGTLEPVVDAILRRNEDSVRRFREGNQNVLGFFVGQVMKETRGRANPELVNALLREKLRG